MWNWSNKKKKNKEKRILKMFGNKFRMGKIGIGFIVMQTVNGLHNPAKTIIIISIKEVKTVIKKDLAK